MIRIIVSLSNPFSVRPTSYPVPTRNIPLSPHLHSSSTFCTMKGPTISLLIPWICQYSYVHIYVHPVNRISPKPLLSQRCYMNTSLKLSCWRTTMIVYFFGSVVVGQCNNVKQQLQTGCTVVCQASNDLHAVYLMGISYFCLVQPVESVWSLWGVMFNEDTV